MEEERAMVMVVEEEEEVVMMVEVVESMVLKDVEKIDVEGVVGKVTDLKKEEMRTVAKATVLKVEVDYAMGIVCTIHPLILMYIL